MSGNVENIFTRDAFTSMFVFINNSIPSSAQQVVDTSVEDNYGFVDKIWPIGSPIPPSLPGEVVSVNRGLTYIRGQLYRVNDTDSKLVPETGSVGYDITGEVTNKYSAMNVVGILVPGNGGTTWTFKYLKSGATTLSSLDSTCLVDDIDGAQRFPLEDNPGTTGDDTANGWIERFFGASEEKVVSGETLSRANFGVFTYQSAGLENLKVASSNRVVVTKAALLEKFALNSMGSGTDKQVFLTYKGTTGMPNRFVAMNTIPIEFNTASMVNLRMYERQIRSVATDAPHVRNFVYKSDSPGFYAVSPWLTSTKIFGRLIQEYNGHTDVNVGPYLDAYGKFSLTREIPGTLPTSIESEFYFGPKEVREAEPTNPSTGDFSPSGTGQEGVLYLTKYDGVEYYWYWDATSEDYTETSDRWDGKFGTKGQFNVRITNPYGDNPTATITSVIYKSYSLTSLPDTRTSQTIGDIEEYLPFGDIELEVNDVEETYDEVTKHYRTFSFSPMMRVTTKKLALNLGSNYIASNGMYVNVSGTMKSQYVIPFKDFNGGPVGELGYGYVSIPMNIDDAADRDYYNSIMEGGQTIDDVPHRTINEYEWSYLMYFKFSGNSGSATPSLNSDGKDYPVSLGVLPAGQAYSEDGDVFNRVYELQTKVMASHVNIDTSQVPLGEDDVWIDKATMVASISAPSNVDTWKRLIYSGTEYDEAVPPRMREGIEKLISKILFLDDNYFELVLTQLGTFFSMIGTELYSGFPKADSHGVYKSVVEIGELCNFGYSIRNIKFKNHSSEKDEWNNTLTGLFGYDHSGTTYVSCLENFNNHLLDEFKSDWRKLVPGVSDHGADSISNRDYHHILLDGNPNFTTAASIYDYRQDILVGNHEGGKDITGIYERINQPPTSPDDIIDEIFKDGEDETWSNKVRYINSIRTTLTGDLVGMFVADDICHLFVDNMWYTFDATKPTMDGFVESTIASDNMGFEFEPKMRFTQYSISNDGWLFKMLNRDFTTVGRSRIQDAFAIHCKEESETDQDLWYIPLLDVYVYGTPSTGGILDMAYEQYGDRLYVLFNGDNHLYAYDDVASQRTFTGFVTLKKETANLKLVTFNSVCLTDHNLHFDRMLLDYFRKPDEEDDVYNNWRISLYGKNENTGKYNKEIWHNRPGLGKDDYRMYNAIMFGDSLFDEGQLRFHNISKNKDMYDILDVNEIDGRYYGLFKNEDESTEGNATYTVFKAEKDGGVVYRLPWQILNRHMFRTNDSLYSLYVVSNEPVGNETYHPVLREITVPDAEEYPERVIDIYELYKNNNGQGMRDATTDPVSVIDLLMDEFKLKSKEGRFFALTNKGFHQIDYTDDFDQLSIDKMDGWDYDSDTPVGFRDRLMDTFEKTVLQKHMDELHDKEQSYYFQVLKSKVNQFADDFTVFDLIPTEFHETQDVGVIPDGPVTDVDDAEDHRDDSILTSTDILWTDGLVAQTDSNPGIVTAAVANPATIYDDDTVFTKSQRNPSIEGTEFYDYIYDQDGNALMDLYAIPFIYRISSNNTYDLYINIPTTRTKYLNRLAGTLMDNGTNQVLPDDTRTRVNFLDEMLPNNLDESTTRLQVFIDKKYISIGTVDLVEASGNSIPTQIYRDVPNNGLYDSIALETRWNGEVVQIDEPSKDINKVMLEFECYGTDSQSIHIQGKTLINRALNETKYGTVENVPSNEVQTVALTFYSNGGTVDEVTRIAIVGELVGELPTPTWEGHDFLGWFTGPGGEYLPDGVQVKGDSFVTADMDTLYAHWAESAQAGG